MNIEKAIKVIDNIQEVQEFDDRLDRVKSFIESQQKTIENMKCCGNCEEVAKKHSGLLYCTYACMDTEHNDKCTAWELKK